MSFKDKVVIITGSSSGIGASAAIAFAKEGANVVVTGRNAEKLKNVENSCAEVGKRPLVINADVSNENEIEKIVKETVDKYGKIDVLINNAGIFGFAAVVDKNCMAVYDKIMNVNVRSALHLIHLASSYLIESKGNIINISSTGGHATPSKPQFVSYCVSKAALNHMTTCVAAEMASYGVRVNAISPGPVRTDIIENSGMPAAASDVFWERLKGGTALKRISEPNEVADLCLYLAGDKAVGITGTNILIDNGMLLGGVVGNASQ